MVQVELDARALDRRARLLQAVLFTMASSALLVCATISSSHRKIGTTLFQISVSSSGPRLVPGTSATAFAQARDIFSARSRIDCRSRDMRIDAMIASAMSAARDTALRSRRRQWTCRLGRPQCWSDIHKLLCARMCPQPDMGDQL
jgi:hypothetical protein